MSRAVLVALMLSGSVSVARADVYDDDGRPPSDPMDVHTPGDEPDGYIGSGLGWATSQGFGSAGAILDIGQRMYDTRWFGHAGGRAGKLFRSDERGHGSFFEVRAGAERRTCSGGGMLCGSAGLDIGVHRGEFNHVKFASNGTRSDFSERLDAVLAVPRFTLDAGGRIRFRGVLELPLRMRTADTLEPPSVAALGAGEVPSQDGGDRQFALGVAFSLGIAVGF